jgi:hypothetical protein
LNSQCRIVPAGRLHAVLRHGQRIGHHRLRNAILALGQENAQTIVRPYIESQIAEVVRRGPVRGQRCPSQPIGAIATRDDVVAASADDADAAAACVADDIAGAVVSVSIDGAATLKSGRSL